MPFPCPIHGNMSPSPTYNTDTSLKHVQELAAAKSAEDRMMKMQAHFDNNMQLINAALQHQMLW